VAANAMQAANSGGGAAGAPGGSGAAGGGSSKGSSAGTSGAKSASTVKGDASSPTRSSGVVRADAFDPLPDRDIPDAVEGGGARGGSRGASSNASGATSRGTNAASGSDASSAESDGERAIDGSTGQRASMQRERLEKPAKEELTVPDTKDPVATGDESIPETIGTSSPLAPLLGFWQQVDAERREADFAPGGFDLALLAIRPTQRSIQVYRAWGKPPEALVIAAELRATFDPAGRVRIEESPAQPSRFPARAIELPARNGSPARTIEPPARALPCDTQWSIDQDGRLRLDGRVYRPIDRAEFDRLGRASGAGGSLRGSAASAGSATGKPAPQRDPAGGVDFFGARVKGRFVCFVCDISGSMMGDKLEALKAELIRTIRALPEGSQVQVTFFDDAAHVLVADWTRTGTPACDTLLRKIDGVGCGGGTDAVDALAYVFGQLQPVPHELFLLTDGRFGRDPAPALAQLNGGTDRTRIHTLGMGDDADTGVLERIAREHGGTYTHVPATPPVHLNP
jgi:hypothetical protein